MIWWLTGLVAGVIFCGYKRAQADAAEETEARRWAYQEALLREQRAQAWELQKEERTQTRELQKEERAYGWAEAREAARLGRLDRVAALEARAKRLAEAAEAVYVPLLWSRLIGRALEIELRGVPFKVPCVVKNVFREGLQFEGHAQIVAFSDIVSAQPLPQEQEQQEQQEELQ